jgi:hypothetical protein
MTARTGEVQTPAVDAKRLAAACALAAAGLGAAWNFFRGKRQSPNEAVGAHATLVPTSQSHLEAKWTSNAFVHASESHHEHRSH